VSILRALGRPRNDAPVPLTPRRPSGFGSMPPGGDQSPLARMGSVGTLFAIVDRIASSVSSIEWELYNRPSDGRVDGEDEREPAGRHAALDLWRQPNPHMTTAEFVHTIVQHRKLVGEWTCVITHAGKIPIELWPVRPDRLTPVTHPEKFLVGWVYKSPDGEKVPLRPDQVIQSKMPNPTDPYRGLGPVQSILTELDAAKFTAEWNKNFFLNSAEPGGVIELPTNLSDAQWDEFVERWRSQHQGVHNAHRVAVIEHAGKYVARGYSQRDMEFTALREASRDTILEAFGISRATLGITDGVNFAAAKAADAQFTKLLTIPELRALQHALNYRLLPQFYPGKRPADIPVEFDFDCKPTEDNAEAAADRTSKVDAVTKLWTLSGVKFDLDELLEAYDLPVVSWEDAPVPLPGQMFGPDGEVLPPPPEPPPDGGESAGAGSAPKRGDSAGGTRKPAPKPAKNEAAGSTPTANPTDGALTATPRAVPHGGAAQTVAQAPDWDGAEHAHAWQRTLDRLLEQWEAIGAAQRAELADQIADAIDSDDHARLADLSVSSTDAAERLHEALEQLARTSAELAASEAPPSVALEVAVPPSDDLEGVAVAVAAMLATALAVAAGREALRRRDGTKTGREIANEVTVYLRELSDRPQRDALGGALTGAQNRARVATFATGPVGALYADERLDSNTCGPCAAINGRWVCNTDDLGPLEAMYTAMGGYVDCRGGTRCRGTVTGAWR
jgi:HK97 family phage portal protein